MFIGLEPILAHNHRMNRVIFPLLAALALLTPPASARGEGLFASDWLDFREARVRLVYARPTPSGGDLRAGLEVSLAPGYKTYWRTAGDSGVPPTFDFSRSEGLSIHNVAFPLPIAFDDGAGGKAWGYKKGVILPIRGSASSAPHRFHLKLDFAVCDKMCIPLSGELAVDLARGSPAPAESAKAFSGAVATLPRPAGADAGPAVVRRLAPASPARWEIALDHPGNAEQFRAFGEAKGFIEVLSITHPGNGRALITIGGQAPPGEAAAFGPMLLTYGTSEAAFERTIDLDAAATSP